MLKNEIFDENTNYLNIIDILKKYPFTFIYKYSWIWHYLKRVKKDKQAKLVKRERKHKTSLLWVKKEKDTIK